MASIRREIPIDRDPEDVWDAVRDVGAIHERFAQGFVTDTTVEPGARVVTFANGVEARELIVDVDDDRRRLAYTVVDGLPGSIHHHATFEVDAGGEGTSRLVWVSDVLPDELAPVLEGMVDLGVEAISRTLTR
jgi:carbon monoxide dehydrogenase subunit G